MIRLDKYLADAGIGTRSEVKKYIRKGQVSVNGVLEKCPERKVLADVDCISWSDQQIGSATYAYYMFYKPAGCISATTDTRHKTVMDYLSGVAGKNLFPVGRLDIDTEGLLLITNDGALAHELLSPVKHVKKTYYAIIDGIVDETHVQQFKEGVDIGEGKCTKPADLKILAMPHDGYKRSLEENVRQTEIELSITEGKFHQVKRMFQAVAMHVTYLRRNSMGSLQLDETLKPGEFRELTKEEVAGLKNP
ncbi:rRNA pseudouridine synthase [Lachnospiraceae bacterium ZAX-1]